MADFSLVDQLVGLRDAYSAAPTDLASYAPPPAPDVTGGVAPRAVPGVSAAAPVAGRAAGNGNYFANLEKQFAGLRTTSGFRTLEHNAEVGGVKNSWHTKGSAENPMAKDYVGSAGDMQRAQVWAKANGAREALIHSVRSGQHLHVAWPY